VSRAPTLLLVVILVLTAAAGAVLAAGARPAAGRLRRAEEFQRLVGGLGFGPARDLARCPFSFDPRLCPACPDDGGPVPGGAFFCPYHASSILDPPPLPAAGGPEDRGPDAHLP
jgi:hypothetical protein